MSSRIFQGVLVQMKEATDRVIGVIDSKGNVVACDELSLVNSKLSNAVFGDTKGTIITSEGKTFKLLGWNNHFDYAVFVDGADDMAHTICVLACVAFSEANAYFEEKYDKLTFVKNIISENILAGDIYIRAKELHFIPDVTRAVLLVRQVDRADTAAIEIIQNLFPERDKDFVFSVSENDIVFIKEIQEDTEREDLMEIAKNIEQAISTELSIKTITGIGSPAKQLKELADRYKEARVAIDVGKVFDTDKSIINYENLGIGRLIYQLPTTLCEMFLSEVFKKNPIESLDQETLYTINKFFENNLNVSETSRKLFVHRNTLVYRLEKIKKLTGLDLREFDHAIVFKVALMVKKYLNSKTAKSLR
ncbi:MAG: PucR family transcriptional regulator [Sporomusa sp.]